MARRLGRRPIPEGLCHLLVPLTAVRNAHWSTSIPLKSSFGIKAVQRQETSGNEENVIAFKPAFAECVLPVGEPETMYFHLNPHNHLQSLKTVKESSIRKSGDQTKSALREH